MVIWPASVEVRGPTVEVNALPVVLA